MGLDLVELALRIEEEFDIILPDADLEKMRTPRDLANFIDQKYQELHANRCSSQIGFYKVRKIFTDTFGFLKDAIKPLTNTQDVLGGTIRNKWGQLQQKLKYPLPSLQLYSRYVEDLGAG